MDGTRSGRDLPTVEGWERYERQGLDPWTAVTSWRLYERYLELGRAENEATEYWLSVVQELGSMRTPCAFGPGYHPLSSSARFEP